MSLRSISVQLDSTRFSDLFFNFEHPEYDRVMRQDSEPTKRRSGQVVELYSPSLAQDEVEEALLKDAIEFSGILGFDGVEQADIAAELTADFLKRR